MKTSEARIDVGRAKDEGERKAIEDIREHGVHILHIFDAEGKNPEFSYTTGLWHTHRHPEVIIIGLKEELCQRLLNNLNYEIGQGRTFTDGLSTKNMLDGYTCYFQALPKSFYKQYLGWGRWFYGGDEFSAVQMIWPNVQGVYPWDENANESFRWQQPVLTRKPLIIS